MMSFSSTEEEGFEPSRRVTGLLVFEARPFSRLGTPPDCYLSYNILWNFSRHSLAGFCIFSGVPVQIKKLRNGMRTCPLLFFMIKFNYYNSRESGGEAGDREAMQAGERIRCVKRNCMDEI